MEEKFALSLKMLFYKLANSKNKNKKLHFPNTIISALTVKTLNLKLSQYQKLKSKKNYFF